VVKLLVEMGNVNINSEDIYGQTPLSWSAPSAQQRHEAGSSCLQLINE
jgi:hypothetical protein